MNEKLFVRVGDDIGRLVGTEVAVTNHRHKANLHWVLLLGEPGSFGTTITGVDTPHELVIEALGTALEYYLAERDAEC